MKDIESESPAAQAKGVSAVTAQATRSRYTTARPSDVTYTAPEKLPPPAWRMSAVPTWRSPRPGARATGSVQAHAREASPSDAPAPRVMRRSTVTMLPSHTTRQSRAPPAPTESAAPPSPSWRNWVVPGRH